MRYVLLLGMIAAATVCMAGAAPALPSVEFLDTEVLTNVPIPSAAQKACKYTFSMAFNGTPSNNVEIAFGMDENGDGTLCDDEVALSAGWDCGEWFVMNAATGERLADAGANGPHELLGGILLRSDGCVRSAAFCDGTTPLFSTLPTSSKSWKFPASWNTARLVGRGDNVRIGERFHISAAPQGFAIRLQ